VGVMCVVKGAVLVGGVGGWRLVGRRRRAERGDVVGGSVEAAGGLGEDAGNGFTAGGDAGEAVVS